MLKMLFWYSPGGTEENNEKLGIANVQAKIQTGHPSNASLEHWH
jgi:hypothetical protein